MDLDDFRSILRNSGMDVWTFIENAISVASLDYCKEFKSRRDGIVEKLYANTVPRCQNCDFDAARLSTTEMREENENEKNGSRREEAETVWVEKDSSTGDGKVDGASPVTPQSFIDREDPDRAFVHRPRDSEQEKLLMIKEQLEDPDQSEDSVVSLLQNLEDMDITFKALKETDIGRHVNGLRKHSSSEVRRLVKQIVRKWKDLVDEWVKLNASGETAAATIMDSDSPSQNPAKIGQNGNQVSDSTYSPNCSIFQIDGNSGGDKKSTSSAIKGKGVNQRENQAKQILAAPTPASLQKQKENTMDLEKLASARRRLHENYQEAENAKRQRTIQVMDPKDLPRPKNSFFRSKGGFQNKHW